MVADAVHAKPVLCAKCGRANDHADRRCGGCGAHLFVACGKCGTINQRSAPRCESCGTRLHRTAWSRLRRHTLKRVKAWEILLVLIVSVLFVFLLLKINRRSQPSPQHVDEPAGEAPTFR
jgi:hypothetical protein